MTKRPRSYDLSRYSHGCALPYRRVAISPQTDKTIQSCITSHHVPFTAHCTFLNIVVACVLVTGLIGCGSSTSDPTPGVNSGATATRGPDVGAQGAGQSSDAGVIVRGGSAERDGSGQHDRSAPDQPEQSAGKPDGGDPSPALNIPDTIAKDLGSPNPSTRYRALDYWETKGTQAPLDPVFEAIEDEDPAVRAKATAIIEQYWAAEQERERG